MCMVAISLFAYKLSLSTLVLNSRDRHENLWLPQNASREQPDNNNMLSYNLLVRCY